MNVPSNIVFSQTLFLQNITTINVVDCGINNSQLKALLKTLTNNLTIINVSWNKISDKGVTYLINHLKHFNHLRVINIANNPISKKALKSLLHALFTQESLVQVSQLINEIIEIRVIRSGLKGIHSPALSLHTLTRSITDKVLSTYILPLIKSYLITALILHDTLITRPPSLTNFKTKSLSNLSLSENLIGSDRFFKWHLNQCHALTTLDLSYNNINDTLLINLIDEISECKHLTKLMLSGNSLNTSDFNYLYTNLNHLKYLGLANNNITSFNYDISRHIYLTPQGFSDQHAMLGKACLLYRDSKKVTGRLVEKSRSSTFYLGSLNTETEEKWPYSLNDIHWPRHYLRRLMNKPKLTEHIHKKYREYGFQHRDKLRLFRFFKTLRTIDLSDNVLDINSSLELIRYCITHDVISKLKLPYPLCNDEKAVQLSKQCAERQSGKARLSLVILACINHKAEDKNTSLARFSKQSIFEIKVFIEIREFIYRKTNQLQATLNELIDDYSTTNSNPKI